METSRIKMATSSDIPITMAKSDEVSSIEWEFVDTTEQEEDLNSRMYRLVGERWDLIAGRIPGRKAEEIERFWIMRHGEVFAKKGRQQQGSRRDVD